DVFAFLEEMPSQQYDLIVLDPPAFAKHHRVKEQGIKGYRNINRKAMSKLKPGGLLFTFSCSQAISIDDFRTIAFSAAAMENKNVRVVHQMQHALDHPVSIYHPEGDYLKGLLLAVE
ncbi:MAG: class I SAM-dependent methyltransferase, partial [Bacteroidales bacterium]|nr:class I SAM-dependent methyltransferase [Bacteroidales bacterium]